MTKSTEEIKVMQDAYDLAALRSLSENPDGTRMDVIFKAMKIYAVNAGKPLINECRRVKIQRNGYEQKLIITNREINFLESEIKHLKSIIKLNGIKP